MPQNTRDVLWNLGKVTTRRRQNPPLASLLGRVAYVYSPEVGATALHHNAPYVCLYMCTRAEQKRKCRFVQRTHFAVHAVPATTPVERSETKILHTACRAERTICPWIVVALQCARAVRAPPGRVMGMERRLHQRSIMLRHDKQYRRNQLCGESKACAKQVIPKDGKVSMAFAWKLVREIRK